LGDCFILLVLKAPPPTDATKHETIFVRRIRRGTLGEG